MKKNLLICGLISLKLATAATAQTVIDSDWPVNQAIPQADPVGITASQTFSGLLGNPISSVTVDLDITGGYNGTLYAYLVLQNANGNNATEDYGECLIVSNSTVQEALVTIMSNVFAGYINVPNRNISDSTLDSTALSWNFLNTIVGG